MVFLVVLGTIPLMTGQELFRRVAPFLVKSVKTEKNQHMVCLASRRDHCRMPLSDQIIVAMQAK